MEHGTRYFGKYRGVCMNNVDPMRRGRIQVTVPDVHGDVPATWALPCVPVAGLQSGFFTVPTINAGVWVEFEQGDPDYPIWVGGFWGSGAEVPPLAQSVPPGVDGLTIATQLQHAVVISDLPGPTGGIMLSSTAGAKLIVNDTGIYIQNGQGAAITLIGPTVSVNNGALTVT